MNDYVAIICFEAVPVKADSAAGAQSLISRKYNLPYGEVVVYPVFNSQEAKDIGVRKEAREKIWELQCLINENESAFPCECLNELCGGLWDQVNNCEVK